MYGVPLEPFPIDIGSTPKLLFVEILLAEKKR